MSSPKNHLILLLALATAGGGILAWQQYQELIKLRAAALNNDERADWQKKLWDSEKKRHELEDALAAAQSKENEGREAGPDGAAATAGAEGPRRRRGPGGNIGSAFMAMMEKPEIQKLMAIQQRSALDARYAALFKSLNLSPAQLDKFKDLLVEKQTSIGDVMAAARAQGVDPRSDPQGFRKLVADEQADIDSSIKAAIGDTAFNQYQQFQQTQPQRAVVSQLEQSLSYTGAPLTQAQSDQMVQILANAGGAPSAAANNRAAVAANFGIGFGGGGGGPAAPITDTVITQAQSVLSSAQVDALRQLQQAQQAQAQINQAMRTQFGGRVTPARSISTTPPGGG